MVKFVFALSVGIALVTSSTAYSMRKNIEEKIDLTRNVSARKYRGEYSVEIEFKALAELAVGNSLNKPLIERYHVAKKEFERIESTFSNDERTLCLNRITAIEEALQGIALAEK